MKSEKVIRWSECRELNPVPLGPEPSVLPMNYTPYSNIFIYIYFSLKCVKIQMLSKAAAVA